MHECEPTTTTRSVLALQELECAADADTVLLSGMSVDCQS